MIATLRLAVLAFVAGLALIHSHAVSSAQEQPNQPLSNAKPVPRMQVLPLPDAQIAITRDGKELTRYYYGADLDRPFLYPIIGPAGRSLTRMGHPHDPNGHSHHNSVWVSHHDVNGIDFWADGQAGQIRHARFEQFVDSDEQAAIQAVNVWTDSQTHQPLLDEMRTMRAIPLENEEWLLAIDLHFTARRPTVTFGDTPFGPLGVRMAKTIGVHDGGGTIRNSEGHVDEAEVFRKPARWVDYSGPITPEANEGITLMNHPSNPTFPSAFHVRNDGWMGTTFSYQNRVELREGETLTLRYGLLIHQGVAPVEQIEQAFERYAKLPLLLPREKSR